MKYAIVCVDDEPLIVDILYFQLKKLFKSETTIIETFTDPLEVEEGIEKLVQYGVDVIFMMVDYQMPKLNGAEVIRTIKSKYPNIKFYMLSGQANYEVVDQLIEEKLLEQFILKPWSQKDLENALRDFLGRDAD
jgi:YesN/AraC family two-component response regulator